MHMYTHTSLYMWMDMCTANENGWMEEWADRTLLSLKQLFLSEQKCLANAIIFLFQVNFLLNKLISKRV